jgi:pilus assembly protein Flp/PilA
MGLIAWKIYFAFRALIEKEDGQDLVEYALIVALIALAATAGMKSLAEGVNSFYKLIAGNIYYYTHG